MKKITSCCFSLLLILTVVCTLAGGGAFVWGAMADQGATETGIGFNEERPTTEEPPATEGSSDPLPGKTQGPATYTSGKSPSLGHLPQTNDQLNRCFMTLGMLLVFGTVAAIRHREQVMDADENNE